MRVVNSQTAKQAAMQEVEEETMSANKKRYKALFRKKKDAEEILANINREIEDLDLELSQDEK